MMTSFPSKPRRGARAHVPCFGEELRPPTLKELLETREKGDSVGSGARGEWGGAGCRVLLSLGTPRGWPLLGVRTRYLGKDTQPPSPQLGSQGRGPGGCIGTDVVVAMNTQCVHPHINYMGMNSELPIATTLNDKLDTLS